MNAKFLCLFDKFSPSFHHVLNTTKRQIFAVKVKVRRGGIFAAEEKVVLRGETRKQGMGDMF